MNISAVYCAISIADENNRMNNEWKWWMAERIGRGNGSKLNEFLRSVWNVESCEY